jgi:hypothetical protein
MKRGWVVDADFEVGSNGRGCDIVATNTVPRLCIGVCRASLIATVVSLAVAVAYECDVCREMRSLARRLGTNPKQIRLWITQILRCCATRSMGDFTRTLQICLPPPLCIRRLDLRVPLVRSQRTLALNLGECNTQ